MSYNIICYFYSFFLCFAKLFAIYSHYEIFKFASMNAAWVVCFLLEFFLSKFPFPFLSLLLFLPNPLPLFLHPFIFFYSLLETTCVLMLIYLSFLKCVCNIVSCLDICGCKHLYNVCVYIYGGCKLARIFLVDSSYLIPEGSVSQMNSQLAYKVRLVSQDAMGMSSLYLLNYEVTDGTLALNLHGILGKQPQSSDMIGSALTA